MEAGYLAAGSGMTNKAVEIFEGVAAARPESEFPDIGRSFAYLCGGDIPEAIRILNEEALVKNPESDLAKSFIGLCLKKGGLNAEANELLSGVVDEGSDSTAKDMAAALLEESEI